MIRISAWGLYLGLLSQQSSDHASHQLGGYLPQQQPTAKLEGLRRKTSDAPSASSRTAPTNGIPSHSDQTSTQQLGKVTLKGYLNDSRHPLGPAYDLELLKRQDGHAGDSDELGGLGIHDHTGTPGDRQRTTGAGPERLRDNIAVRGGISATPACLLTRTAGVLPYGEALSSWSVLYALGGLGFLLYLCTGGPGLATPSPPGLKVRRSINNSIAGPHFAGIAAQREGGGR